MISVRPLYVYVASPYSNGDQAKNVADSIQAGEQLAFHGYIPFLPLLYHFWHYRSYHDYGFWIKLTLPWVRRCDVVLRLPGKSEGADAEVAEAKRLGLPVFDSVQSLLRGTEIL